MALNPFEQLRLLGLEPRTAFEEIVGLLLYDHGLSDGQLKIHVGDDGVDAYQGSFGQEGELTVYQIKYFPDQWQDSQKEQIRNSFRTASESNRFKLKKWYLCIPTRPTKDDVRWFDTWKSKQPIKEIDFIDGDDLTKMLETPAGARARKRLRDAGVFTVTDGSAVLEFSVVCAKQHQRSHFTLRLGVWLENKGDRTAQGLKVKLEHSDTNCVPVQTDRSIWDDLGNGVLNPRTISAVTTLHPGQRMAVLQVPLSADTLFPLWIKAAAWLQDATPTEQSIVLQKSDLADDKVFKFNAGAFEANASLDGGFRSKPLRSNFSATADELFVQIADNPNTALFGVLCYWQGDKADPKTGLYRPSLSPTGFNHRMDKASLQSALEELVDIGWLEPPERVGEIDLYRLSDHARENELFLYNVNDLAKKRAYR